MSGWRLPTGPAVAAALAAGVRLSPLLSDRSWAALGAAAVVLVALTRDRRRLRGHAASMLAVVLAAGAAGALRAAPPPEAPLRREHAAVAGRILSWEAGESGVGFRLRVRAVDGRPVARPYVLRGWGPVGWGALPRSRWLRVAGRVEPDRGVTNPGARADPRAAGRIVPDRGAAPEWGPGPPPAGLSRRAALAARTRALLPGFPGRLARAMLLGRSHALRPGEREAFRRSGALHLTAVSGLHVGLAVGLALLVLGALPRGPRYALAAGVGWGYSALAAFSPSSVRAAAMASLFAAGLLSRRPRPALQWLALALPWLLLAAPGLAGSVGFLLSVGAVAGILLALELLRPGHGRRAALLGPVGAGLGAQWGTLPASIAVFGAVSPLALLPNLAVIPLAGLFLPAVLLALAAAPVPGLGPAFAGAARLLGAAIGWILGAFSRHAPFVEGLPMPPPWTAALYPAIVAGWFAAPRSLRLRASARGLAAGLAGAAALLTLAPWPPPPGPWFAFLDVGQGDAAVFRLSDGTVWAVDVGDDRGPGDAARNAVLPFLRRRRVRRVDGLILSHRHRDHVGALGPFLEGIRVERVYDAGYGMGRGTGAAVDSALAAHALAACLVAAGDTLYAAPGATIVALHPPRGDPTGPVPYGNLNEASLMVRVVDGSTSALFAGDGERHAEAWCAASGEPLRSEILKVGHHGSRTSSTPVFLDRVRPRIAVISCGVGNRYGHPSPETVAALAARGITVYRTDRDGAVVVDARRPPPAVALHPPRAGTGPGRLPVRGASGTVSAFRRGSTLR